MKRFLCFGKFRLDSRSGELFRDGRAVQLPPQPTKLLLLLVSARGALVTREEIQKTLWPEGEFVDFDLGISKCIKQVRAVLREETDGPGGYVQTVSRRGYRFEGTVQVEEQMPIAPPANERRRRLWKAGAVAAASVLALGGLVLLRLQKRPEPAETRMPRFQLSLPRGVSLPGFNEPVNMIAISPDASHVAFVGCYDLWTCQLYVRDLSDIDAHPLPGTEGAMSPFFSPDGRWIAFGAGYTLKKVDWNHGTVQTLATESTVVRGGSWAEDGTILFAMVGRGLLRVSSDGGEVTEVTNPDPERKEFDHLWPHILPGGRAALFEVRYEAGRYGSLGRGFDVAVVDFDTGKAQLVVERAGDPKYIGEHILFGRDGILHAAPFDPDRLEFRRIPVPVLDGVAMWSSPGVSRSRDGEVQYDIAKDGTLLYSPWQARLPQRTLVLVDREGRRVWSSQVRRAYNRPFFSPDGLRLAASVGTDDGTTETFVVTLARDAWARVGGERDVIPKGWMPDGNRLLLHGASGGLLLATADGDEPRQTLYTGPVLTASAVPDGNGLLFTGPHPGSFDILRLTLTGGGKAEPWIRMPGVEHYAVSVSPDGRFVAYSSTDSGRGEIYVSPFSAPGRRRQVSTQGGDLPEWSKDGKEIFFTSQRSLWSAAVHTSPDFDCDPPRKLFDMTPFVAGFDNYDGSPDGKLFAVVERDPFELRPLDLVVVPRFVEEMESRLAAK